MKKLSKNIGLALAAMALGLSVTSAVAQVTNVAYETTFEQEPISGRPNFTWNYQYSWGYADPAPQALTTADTWWVDAPDYTNTVMAFTFDNSMMNPTPSGGGYGVGFGGVLRWATDTSVLTSTNRADYIIEFDAKAEGLLPDQTSANGEFQVVFTVPDNTFEAPDDNDFDTVLQVNFAVHPGTNWTHYAFTLEDGSIGGGSERLFAEYLSQHLEMIQDPRFGFNFHQPEAQFGWDTDNAVYLDNMKLSVVVVSNAPPLPKVGLPVVDWNFDDKPLWYSWAGGGWSANGLSATYTVNHAAAGAGVGGSNAYVMGMDNSNFAPPNTPQWAGGNTGGGGAGDYTLVNTSDLGAYRFSFDARVQGLAQDITTVGGGTIQLFINVPDDTLQPPDSGTGNDTLIRLDFNFSDISSNFQNYAFLLSKGSVGGGSKLNFTNFFNVVNEISMQAQINSANSANWSYDGDNALIIDNFKIERLVVGCPALRISQNGANIVVQWEQPSTGTSKLQSSSDATSWTDVAGATSGYSVPAANAPKFFRTQWIPPAP